ncbi:MAG: hypothetical protein A2669_00430 [Candidatus Yanofskybacteria bacterium RIFCSPHIGHO2_01_FULL_48_25b]|uniref:Zinc finger DksA/TraR C4-type domain-containing protein n=1 Tax=Candidatus Yanofskybacteria bacterium RIFCSPHIGHO2_01_FULL_48_25b TaxID=1802672 RepID=A0A1F8F225_9BACT|nr:MAG: hypothetical protein A2669_00430 [Candidatus Yanofskybacteria bacterium RIFCSPHIGHO2_01_FULL_48_25b]
MNISERREKLIAKRATLLVEIEKYQKAREPGDRSDGGDVADYNQSERERLSNFNRLSGEICQIDTAIGLIDSGWNGNCLDCGEPIAEPRIRAILHARICISCKEKKDDEAAASQPFKVVREVARRVPPNKTSGRYLPHYRGRFQS